MFSLGIVEMLLLKTTSKYVETDSWFGRRFLITWLFVIGWNLHQHEWGVKEEEGKTWLNLTSISGQCFAVLAFSTTNIYLELIVKFKMFVYWKSVKSFQALYAIVNFVLHIKMSPGQRLRFSPAGLSADFWIWNKNENLNHIFFKDWEW